MSNDLISRKLVYTDDICRYIKTGWEKDGYKTSNKAKIQSGRGRLSSLHK